MFKSIYKFKWVLLTIFCLHLVACKQENVTFEAVLSDGVLITPKQKGRQLQEVNVTISPTPTQVNFGVALYKVAVGDVQVELEFDPSLVEEYNKLNKASYAHLPVDAAELSSTQAVIKAGTKATEGLHLIIRSSMIQKGVNYMLPLRVKSATGQGVTLNRTTAIKYFSIRG